MVCFLPKGETTVYAKLRWIFTTSRNRYGEGGEQRGGWGTCRKRNHLPNGPKTNCSSCCCWATVPQWDSACANVQWESLSYPGWEMGAQGELVEGPGVAELCFPQLWPPESSYFSLSSDLSLPPRSHNMLKINSEARPVPESNGTPAVVLAGQFVSGTFSVK